MEYPIKLNQNKDCHFRKRESDSGRDLQQQELSAQLRGRDQHEPGELCGSDGLLLLRRQQPRGQAGQCDSRVRVKIYPFLLTSQGEGNIQLGEVRTIKPFA